jgi:hypothetical protein
MRRNTRIIFQYEVHLRKCGRPKNPRKEEWRAVDAHLRQLLALKFQTRIKVSGWVLSKDRIERSRRHAILGVIGNTLMLPVLCPCLISWIHADGLRGLALPSPDRITIKIRKSNEDEWSPYTAGHTRAYVRSSASTNDHAVPEPAEPLAPGPTLKEQALVLDYSRLSPQLPHMGKNAAAVHGNHAHPSREYVRGHKFYRLHVLSRRGLNPF